jgi:hypothetical protein
MNNNDLPILAVLTHSIDEAMTKINERFIRYGWPSTFEIDDNDFITYMLAFKVLEYQKKLENISIEESADSNRVFKVKVY